MFGNVKNNIFNIYKSKICDFTDVLTGGTPSREIQEFYNGNIPWVKTGEISKKYITSSEEYITEKAVQETNCKVLPINTIMIAMYGQGKTRGQTGLLKIEAATNQACAAIIPNNRYNSLFLYKQLDLLYNELREMGRGGNQLNLNLSMIKNFEVLMPSINRQNDFSNFVDIIDKQKFINPLLKGRRSIYDKL